MTRKLLKITEYLGSYRKPWEQLLMIKNMKINLTIILSVVVKLS